MICTYILHPLIELVEPPSHTEWIYLLFVLGGLTLCIAACELIRKYFRWSAEVTRKIAHVSIGILIFFAPKLFQSAGIPLLLAFCAALIMAVAVRKGLLVGMHGTSRFSYGTVFYPLSFFLLVILFWNQHPEIISLSILGFALGDASAAIVGNSFRSARVYHLTSDKKSVEGSITMFIATSVSLFCGVLFLRHHVEQSSYVMIVVAAGIATAWEAISSKGLDNLTVPMSIAFTLFYFLVPTPMQNISQYTIGIALALFIAVVSFFMKYLNASGAVATFLLASTIYGIGGWKWTVPILAFFILSSVLSKAGKKEKRKFDHLFEKTGTRDWGQVVANGGIAGIIVLIQYVWYDIDFYPIYLGAIAAVTADTWGTEIGIWFHGKTISLPRFKTVEPGTNGGISLVGFIGGAVGACIISGSAFPWISTVRCILYIVMAGIVGSFVDSYIGAALQATYRCSKCRKYTERKQHCDVQTDHIKGIRWVNNDIVNGFCAFSGAITAWVLR